MIAMEVAPLESISAGRSTGKLTEVAQLVNSTGLQISKIKKIQKLLCWKHFLMTFSLHQNTLSYSICQRENKIDFTVLHRYTVYISVILFLRGENMANITVTLDDEDKRQLTEFCDQIGVSVSTLFTIFSKKVIREWEIPFKIGLDKPNRATIRAMKEGEKILKNLDKVKVYDNVEDALMELKR